MFFFHFLWFLPPKGSKAKYVFKMRSWPNFDLMVFSATYFCFVLFFFWSISVVWHSHSILGWVLSFCDFWLIATGKVLFQFLPWDYRRKLKTVNISQSFLGLCAIKKQMFSLKNYLNGCDLRIMKPRGNSFLFEERAFYCLNQQII